MNYKIYILKKLIKKYENSVLSKNGSERNLKIYFKFDLKNLKDYCNEDSYKYTNKIETDVEDLENKKLIFKEMKNNRIEKVILNIKEIDNVYNYCGLSSKVEINNTYISIINKYNTNAETAKFKDYILDSLKNFKNTSKYFNNEGELEDIMKLLSNLDNSYMSLRNYSAKYLNDSKRLENLKSRINNIIKDIFNLDISFYEFFEKYNVYKNPTYIHLKGKGIFYVDETLIDLDKFDNELILSTKQVEDTKIISVGEKIITIENLTTFNDIKYQNNLIIYLGGYHDYIKNILLKKIYDYDENKNFIHIGDIDAGGFYILNHLIEDTKINFKTYKMDVETLHKYKKYCKHLTANDKERINKLKNIELLKEYTNVFNYMLDNDIKLEQENIIYF